MSDKLIEIEAVLRHETDMAFLLDDGENKIWVPKSLVENNDDGTFTQGQGLHMKLCTIEGCLNKHLAKGMCSAHYQRLYDHGRLHTIVRRDLSCVERILSKIEITAGGCWLYTGKLTKKGYAHVRDGTMRFAHVVMWVNKHGPVPEGMELDHLCRNHHCCNPDHVEPVTHAENVRRGIAGVVARGGRWR